MSRWTIPACFKVFKAAAISFANKMTTLSDNPLAEAFKNLYKSPPSQNYVMIKQKVAVSKMS